MFDNLMRGLGSRLLFLKEKQFLSGALDLDFQNYISFTFQILITKPPPAAKITFTTTSSVTLITQLTVSPKLDITGGLVMYDS